MSTGGAVDYVMRFLAERVSDPRKSAWLEEIADANVKMLDLSNPEDSELVDIIVNELPAHVTSLEDHRLRDSLAEIFEDLYEFAREQQDYNRNPTQATYYTIGPSPPQYFDLQILRRIVERELAKVNYVRIDVSDYTPEQRAAVQRYVAELPDRRVIVVGDEQ
ncbi:hypothetical protein [Mycobacterium sp. 050134]|uniref:hypothetical protein n=1 Tax=Mycobacterium sp. 050134 TaxID=3096111 RepID=UPI002EDAB888